MRIHYLQHVPFEDLGYVRHWADFHEHSITKTALFSSDSFPDISDFDSLIVLGGPMGVNDINAYPWLLKEKRFIEQAIKAEKSLLGICLGAQLIADVLGARIYKNPYKEIGWYMVSRIEASEQSPLKDIFPKRFYAFHWHGDTFELPTGAVHLAESQACRNQAFGWGSRIIGLQFHLESTPESIENLLEHCGNELIPGQYIQSADGIRKESDLFKPSNDCMRSVLNFIESGCSIFPGK